MAGSYKHVVTDSGKLRQPRRLLDMLDCHHGDVYEAIEEMYGMIWLLADGDAARVEDARQRYRDGISLSPGLQNRR